MPKPLTKSKCFPFKDVKATVHCGSVIMLKLTQSLFDMAHANGLTAYDSVTWTPEATDSYVKS